MVMVSPRGEKTTPTLLQPRQPVLRESHNDDDDAVFDGDNEKEDDDDADKLD